MAWENDISGVLTDMLFLILRSAPTETFVFSELETYVDDLFAGVPGPNPAAVKGALKRILRA